MEQRDAPLQAKGKPSTTWQKTTVAIVYVAIIGLVAAVFYNQYQHRNNPPSNGPKRIDPRF